MLGFPILYRKGMRIMMFQLSGFYYIVLQENTLLFGSLCPPRWSFVLDRSLCKGSFEGPFKGIYRDSIRV